MEPFTDEHGTPSAESSKAPDAGKREKLPSLLKLKRTCAELEDALKELKRGLRALKVNAEKQGRDLTRREDDRFYEMLAEAEAIESALYYLSPYTN